MRRFLAAACLWTLASPAFCGLPARVQGAADAARRAVQEARWEDALSSFTAVQRWAYGRPDALYNLGLANDKAGRPLAAAAWWMAYAERAPGAPLAKRARRAALRRAREQERQAAAVMEEAFKAATRLSKARPSPKSVSIRRAQLDEVLAVASRCVPERALRDMMKRARAATPGEVETALLLEAGPAMRAVGAAFMEDPERAEFERAKFPGTHFNIDGELALMYAQRGDADKALGWLEPHRLSSHDRAGNILVALRENGQHEALEQLLTRELSAASAFDPILAQRAVFAAEADFWRGDRVRAARLARAVIAHVDRFQTLTDLFMEPYARLQLFIALAITGDLGRLGEALDRSKLSYEPVNSHWLETLLPVAAEQDPSWAASRRDAAIAWSSVSGKADFTRIYARAIEASLEMRRGDDAAAFSAIDVERWMTTDSVDQNYGYDPQRNLARLLDIAVARGRPAVAIEAARTLQDGRHASRPLRALASRLEGADKALVEGTLREMWGGEEPWSLEREALWVDYLEDARRMQEKHLQDRPVPADFDGTLAGKAEDLPEAMAWNACKKLINAGRIRSGVR